MFKRLPEKLALPALAVLAAFSLPAAEGDGATPPAPEAQTVIEQGKDRAIEKVKLAQFYYDMGEYTKARDVLTSALILDPKNPQAQSLMSRVQSMFANQTDTDKIQGAVHVLQEADQQMIMDVRLALEKARQALKNAQNPDKEMMDGEDTVFAYQVRESSSALGHLDRVDELIRYSPERVDVHAEREEAMTLRRAASQIHNESEVNLANFRKSDMLRRKSDIMDRENLAKQQRIDILLDQAERNLEQGEYEKAESICSVVLRDDPFNGRAISIQEDAKNDQYNHELSEIKWLFVEHLRLNWEHVDEVGIPPAKYLTYGEDWHEIVKNRTGTSKRRSRVSPADQRTNEKLSIPITFNFDTDTPFKTVKEVIQNKCGVNMVFDANATAAGAGDKVVQLAVTDMPCREALLHALKQIDMTFRVQDGVVMMYNAADTNLKPPTIIEIYDIRDLIGVKPNYDTPNITILIGGAGAPPPPTPPAAGINDNEIVDLIRKYVQPETWGQGGANINADGAGKLLVTQTPEIQDAVELFLKKLRDQQSVQVLVETQFIEVKNQLLEELGVHFTGIDNVTTENGLPWVVGRAGGRDDPNEPNSPADTVGGTRPPGFYRAGGGPGNAGQYRFTNTHPRAPGAPYGMRDMLGASLGMGMTTNRTRLVPLGNGTLGDLSSNGLAGTPGQGLLLQARYSGSMLANAILQAVSKDQTTDQLIAPRLTVFNGQRSYVLIGQQTAYISDYNVNGTSLDPVISYFLTGAILGVKPNVSHDRRYITLDLEPAVSVPVQLRNIVYTLPGVPAALQPIIELPTLELRSLKTTATVPDGGSLVLSGMITDQRFDGRTGVPILMDIPIVGRLFVNNYTERDRRNLIIIVRGKMVLFDEEEAKLP
ncbi:MAG TPA: hypothetical protein VL860_07930 [Planctomycetota bacterium]|nr:hypothetical protein [Planctomycetota bacterium]